MAHKNVKTNAMRILTQSGIAHREYTYDCDGFTDGVTVAGMLGQDVRRVFKTLAAQGKSGAYYVFVIPVAAELDLKKAAAAAGEKSVQMLHVKDLTSVTGYVRGGCSPIGMKKAYPTFVDDSACALEEILVSGGRIGSQIALAPDDLVRVVNGTYAQLTAAAQSMVYGA